MGSLLLPGPSPPELLLPMDSFPETDDLACAFKLLVPLLLLDRTLCPSSGLAIFFVWGHTQFSVRPSRNGGAACASFGGSGQNLQRAAFLLCKGMDRFGKRDGGMTGWTDKEREGIGRRKNVSEQK